MVDDRGFIYPNTDEGFDMMAAENGITVQTYGNGVPSCLRGIITYIGSDAVGEDETGARTAGGHGYVVTNDQAGSCKWAGDPKALARSWNTNFQVVESAETKYWWYLGTKDDYQKAIIANDVVNKDWFKWFYGYYTTIESLHFWSWYKFTSTESGSDVWSFIERWPDGSDPYITFEKIAKKSTLFGVDASIEGSVMQLFAF
jgi:hypothetical protein